MSNIFGLQNSFVHWQELQHRSLETEEKTPQRFNEAQKSEEKALKIYKKNLQSWNIQKPVTTSNGEHLHGAYGKMYWAGKNRVVKIMHPTDHFELQCVQKEIQYLGKFTKDNAPHSVKQFGSGHYKNKEYFSCQNYAGRDLFVQLKNNSYAGLPIERLESISKQLLEYLLYLKKNNLVHCDLKPENFAEDTFGNISVFDLGYMRKEDSIIEEIPVYYKEYRPPEAILRAGIGTHSDMWALGCILFELLTGDTLFSVNYSGKNRHVFHSVLLHTICERLGIKKEPLNDVLPQDMLKALNKKFFVKEKKGGYSLSPAPIERETDKKFTKDISISRKPLPPKVKRLIILLLKMLKLDPQKRITPKEALEDPFFTIEPSDVCFKPQVKGETDGFSFTIYDENFELLQTSPLDEIKPCYHLPKRTAYTIEIKNNTSQKYEQISIENSMDYLIDTSDLSSKPLRKRSRTSGLLDQRILT